MSDDLKERLENLLEPCPTDEDEAAVRDALALITSLTADVARLEAAAEGSVPVGGALSLLAEKDAKIASLTAELTAARAEVERLRGAVKPILAARDAFDLSDRNQASAYYTLVDRPDGAWKALRAALTPAEEVEG